VIYAGRRPATKADGIASKHWHRTLLPALPYRSVAVLEGPNDFTVVQTLSLRLLAEAGKALLAARGMAVVHAGTAGGGGYSDVVKLAAAAREMGIRAVGVVDGDKNQEAIDVVNAWLDRVDVVVRLPDGIAIERALVSGVSEQALRQALNELVQMSGRPKPQGADAAPPAVLEKLMVSYIKANSLHGQFIDVLDAQSLPSLTRKLLDTLAELAVSTQTGLVQL
jgi:hypothetical protein